MVTAIEARGLRMEYPDGHVAVEGLDLEVRRGEVHGFVGPNGAGKTTTVRMLTGVSRPTEGTARVAGVDVTDARLAQRIGVVWGENLMPEPSWSAVRYLRHFARLHGVDDPDPRIRSLLDLLRMETPERPIRTLSGGNQRKVEIARAMLHEPQVLFLDEPTRELDLLTRRGVWAALARSVRERGLTVFLSSHDPEEIAALCHRVTLVRRGQVVWAGSKEELTARGASMGDALVERLEGRAYGT